MRVLYSPAGRKYCAALYILRGQDLTTNVAVNLHSVWENGMCTPFPRQSQETIGLEVQGYASIVVLLIGQLIQSLHPVSTGYGHGDSGGVLPGLTSDERTLLLQAMSQRDSALQHGAGVSNAAPGLCQASDRQVVGQASRLSARL